MTDNAEYVLPDEDDLTHYMRAVTRLSAENKRLRRELDDLKNGTHPTHRLVRIDGSGAGGSMGE